MAQMNWSGAEVQFYMHSTCILDFGKYNSPILHSSLSMLQVLPVYPDGQLQLYMPLMGLVSHLEPPLQGLLIQASSRWHSSPVRSKKLQRIVKKATV